MKRIIVVCLTLLAVVVCTGLLAEQRVSGAREPNPSTAELLTDQPAYAAGGTAYLLGSGFSPHETVVLQVQRAAEGPGSALAHAPWSVEANGNGDFLTQWQVCADDCIGFELEVSAVGQDSGRAAAARFLDQAPAPVEAASPAVVSQPKLVRLGSGSKTGANLQGWFNLSQQWGGTIQGSNSRYGEGDTLPLRFTASLAPGGTHTLLLKYDFSTGGPQRFFDSLGSFNTTVSNFTLVAGVSGAGSPSQWNIPADASLAKGAQLPGVLTTYNISQLSFAGYTLSNGVKVLALTFVVANNSTTNLNIIIGYGAHLASASVWGAGNGASLFPGASQKAYASLDGASDINESVNPGSIVAAADLSLLKSASPEPVISGNNLTYQLVVTNNGPDPAASVVVQDLLPPGATFLTASASQGTWTSTNGVTFSLGTVYPSNRATMTIVAKVTSPYAGTITNVATLITNKATVSSTTYDPVPANNTANAVSTVILDTIPPVITCPGTIVQPMDPGQCFATVQYTVTATDPGAAVTLSCTPPSGSRFAQGTNTVVCVATDAYGNTSSCSFKVVVLDTQPPALTCPASVVVTNDPGFCSAVVKFNIGVSDNCPGAVVGSSPVSGTAFPVGTNTVLCVARDAAGNTNACSFTITVLDREPPKPLCPADIVTTTDSGSCFATVTFALPTATDNCGGPVSVSCNPPSGSIFAIGTNPVVCTAIDTAGNSNLCVFNVVVQDPGNQVWPQATTLTLVDSLGVQQASAQQCLTALDQSRWFKFKVHPGSRVIVTLTDLPENYDLVLFKDIAAAYQTITSLGDLAHVSAEFASDGFSPSAFSSDAFSPSAFSPSAFSPSAFSSSTFSPSAFSPSAFSPSAFSPSAFSPDAFAPSAFSPSAFSASAFSPSAFSPSAFSPSAFSAAAFSAAQIQSVLAVSAFDGNAGEGIIADTWDISGDFYLRVRGRNGIYSTANPFRLTVYQVDGGCGQVSPSALDSNNQPLATSTTAAPAGNYKTIILTDLNRWLGPLPSADKANVSASLATLAARPEVNGVVVDVGSDPAVAFFNAQADKYYDCPFAKNLVAGAVKAIVDRSRAGNQLQYVVLVGDDSVIPFFRYPDEALLGPENNYVPPVKDLTPSQASLRLNRVLGQDAYGSSCDLSLKSSSLPLPDLAVGRLVQSPTDVLGMLAAYLATPNGVAPTPAASLVTGYDFMADDAQAVSNELAAAIGNVPDALISPNTLPPALCWTADNLRQALFSKRHDLVFLAGHFSSGETLAADYTTHAFASELAASSTDFRNTLVISMGCHSGYNVVAADGIPSVTLEPDWVQACARKQATLVAGTGYQYGDTDFIEYSERLYLNLVKALRTGPGPVSVGQALVHAKHAYLEATPEMRGIHAKAYLEATLFGLPMFSVNFPAARINPAVGNPVITSTPVVANPGAALGLSTADIAVSSTLTPTQIALTNPQDGTQTMATYLAGGSGIVNNPTEPVLPLEARNVSVNGTVLRGVGFRGGSYTDLAGIIPLTGAPTTEIRGVHATFLSAVFYPMRPWNVNYFGTLCGGVNAMTSLMAIPGQFISDSPTAATGTLREFSEMDFRLFYSSNVTTYVDTAGNASTPALAAAPAISGVLGITSGNAVALSARVVGNPAAGVQEVWVTYTATSGSKYGKWQSVELTQNANDTTLWQGTLPLDNTAPSSAIRYMVQAVNGVGVVALDTKLGAYHIPDEFDSGSTANLGPTLVTLQSAPANGAFGSTVTFTAQLTAAGGATLGGQKMVFRVGAQELWAITDSSGVGSVNMPLRSPPADYQLTVSFPGASGLAPSFTTAPFTVTRQTTALGIAPTLVYVKPGADSTIVATLTDGAGNRIIERTVLFVVTGPNGAKGVPVITDINGRAPLGPVSLPAGTYNVYAYFNGTIPLPGQTIHVDDGRYNPSTTAGIINVTLVLDDQPPLINCSTNIVQPTAPGRCDAVVNYITTATDNNPGVSLVCTPPSGSVFPKGTNLVTCVATDLAGNTSTCAFTVAVVDNEPPRIQSLNASPNVISPPNHTMVLVTVTVAATDNCGTMNARIISVASSDPTNTTGDGNTGGDWDIVGPLTVYLRAERASSGVGRTYTLTIQATDPSGDATTGTVTVFVPPNGN